MTGLPEPFRYEKIEAGDTVINAAVAGRGEPLLLLHGYPQTHLIWRHIGPALAGQYTVVATDLRGYGDSGKPAPDAASTVYAKRAMARDQAEVMWRLGFERFAVISHDRGARVGHRLALDYPDAVSRLTVLDIVPTRHAFTHVTRTMAKAYFHWFFLAAGGGIPERLLGNEPEFWIRTTIEHLLAPGSSIEPAVMDEYVRCFSDPATIAATCADYRAGATTDLADDEDSAAAGQKVTCPVLVLWGERSFVGQEYQPVEAWREYATDVRGRALPAGHFLPEEVPGPILDELRAFLP